MIAIATCHFNFAGYSRSASNLRWFLRHAELIGVPVFGTELYLQCQEPVTSSIPGWEQVKVGDRAVMWQKEKLLNHTIKRIPSEYNSIAWIDADVLISPLGWHGLADSIISSHGTKPVVMQPFRFADWTGESGEVFLSKQSGSSWLSEHGEINIGVCHYGFAWAANRSALSSGLYDACVFGGGDIVNFIGLAVGGGCNASIERQVGVRMMGVFDKWRSGFIDVAAVGHLDGRATHSWHGSIKNRQFLSRHQLSHLLEPDSLIDCGTHYEWSASADYRLRERAKSLFLGRMEDGPKRKCASISVSSQPAPISVVMTTHSAYREMVDVVATSIERNCPRGMVMIGDSADLPQRGGWIVKNASFGNPNPARNMGLQSTETDWIVFWDGDNIMPPGYIERMSIEAGKSGRSDAILYPDIQLSHGIQEGSRTEFREMPEYSYWKLRDKTFIDTSSAWRREAVCSAGGFSASQVKYDDYELALRLTRLGWLARRSGAVTRITQHGGRRSMTNSKNDALWTAYRFAFVTLFGPSCDHSMIIEWYSQAQRLMPPNSRIVWGCDFKSRGSMPIRLAAESMSVPVEIIDTGTPFIGASHSISRHQLVASIYGSVLSGIRDDFVMVIEDDNIGPINGPRELFRMFAVNGITRAMHGPYRSRSNPQMACLSVFSDRWKSIKYEDVPNAPFQAGMTGGGFTMYANSSLSAARPIRCTENPLLGWDANISISIASHGNTMMANGAIRVDHMAREVLEYLRK